MDIQLIAMDLDGTTLQNDHKTFSPRLWAALEAAHEKGVAIVPVTGRQFSFLPPPLTAHPIWENLAVLCNGSQVRKLATGACLFELTIENQALRDLLALAQKFNLPIEFSSNDILHLTQRHWDEEQPIEVLAFHKEILASHAKVVESLVPFCADDWVPVEKVNLPYIPPHLHSQVLQELKHIAVSAVWASASSIEITHPDATKGRGLSEVCRLLGIPPENAMSLGDSGNDETMLRMAGLGVAMGNAPDFVKAAADVVTDTNTNDGAAKAIEEYVLK